MSAYSSLHLSNTPIIGNFPTDTKQEYFSKDLIPLFWLSLFSEDDIYLHQSDVEDEDSFYFLQTDRINAIHNFQKYFGIWIHFNNEAFQLAPLFLDFLKNKNEQYVTLRLNDIYAMGGEPSDPSVHEDIIEMLNFYPEFYKNPNFKKVKNGSHLGLSIDLYLNDHVRNALDGEMFTLGQDILLAKNPEQTNRIKSFFSNFFKKS